MTQGTPDTRTPSPAPPRIRRPAGDGTTVALSVITGLSLAVLVAAPIVSTGAIRPSVVTIGALFVLGGAGLVLFRHTRRRVRNETLRAVRGMLRDRMSDPLHTLLRAAVPPGDPPGPEERARIGEIVNAVRSVEATLELISLESLEAWQHSRTQDPR